VLETTRNREVNVKHEPARQPWVWVSTRRRLPCSPSWSYSTVNTSHSSKHNVTLQ